MQAIYGNLDNAARTGSIAATSFVPSNSYVRTSATRTGGGQVSLTGDFTGAADATFEVEIQNSTIVGTPIISSPVFVGVGNGTISSVAATGAATARTITITLTDTGTRTVPAYANFGPVTLEASTAGSAGNDIEITIDRSGITATLLTDVSVSENLTARQNEYRGRHFDLAASTLLADGTIPADARRIRFEHQPYVYRQYRKYVEGEYVYSFSPPLFEDVPKGTRIYEITGTLAATISDGVTTESGGNLSDIVTTYDFLAGIQSDSSLVEVDGVVANDLLPGGMGATELNVFTESFVRSLATDGGRFVRGRNMSAVSVDTDAPTETVTITCVDASIQGAEQWEVEGTVSGVLGAKATTNVAYSAAPVNFTILPETVDGVTPAGSIQVRLDLEPRAEGETIPVLCEDKVRALLGSRATDGVWRFTYTRRPVEADCSEISITGGPNESCLGTEVDAVITGLSVEIRLWAERTEALFADLYRDEDTPEDTNLQDFNVFDQCRREMLSCLRDINDSGDTDYDAWTGTTAQVVGDIVIPTTANGYRYACVTAGTTGGTEPSWTTVPGERVADGSVVWEVLEKEPLALFEDKFLEVRAHLSRYYRDAYAALTSSQEWSSSDTRANNVITWPTTVNGHAYRAEVGGTTAGTEPTWPTNGGTVTDGTVVWRDMGSYWSASEGIPKGRARLMLGKYAYQAIVGGITGSTEPTWGADKIIDGTVTWQRIGGYESTAGALDFEVTEDELTSNVAGSEDYYRVVRAAMREVRIAAGILDFDGAGSGGRCWSDPGDPYWWVSDKGLLPAFTHRYYHSARKRTNDQGETVIESTREFGFAPAVAGPLKTGDTIVVTIVNAQGTTRTYQQGDRYSFEVVNSGPVQFGGGQDGNDTLTWRVHDSVDGVLTPYALDLDSPAAYNADGVTFSITEGAIPFELGDEYTFSFEGGQFRWRKDGGSWTSGVQIAASVVLSDGVSAVFDVGKAPSFPVGDTYNFIAQAINGPGQAVSPTEGRMEFDDATTITIANGGNVSDLLLYHTLDSGASITLQGSDDSFSTTPLSESVAWNEGVIVHRPSSSSSYAEYRIVITDAGTGATIQWAWLGAPWNPTRTGSAQRSRRILGQRSGPNYTGSHVGSAGGASLNFAWMAGTNADDLESLMVHAAENDDCRIGALLSSNLDEAIVGYFDAESIEFTDRRTGYQAADKANRIVSTSFELRGLL